MPVEIPRSLVEFILLGPEDDRRQLQDSPILGDVWIAFGEKPQNVRKLLVTPYKEEAASLVAKRLAESLESLHSAQLDPDDPDQGTNLAHLQGIIAVTLTFELVLKFLVPLTNWWKDKSKTKLKDYGKDQPGIEKAILEVLSTVALWRSKKPTRSSQIESRMRFVTLAGLLLWARKAPTNPALKGMSTEQVIDELLKQASAIAQEGATELAPIIAAWPAAPKTGYIWTISLNRRATGALTKSVPAVKADAARTLFRVDCKEIVWAIIDSGVDATHPAFIDRNDKDRPKASRVKKSFDFALIKRVLSYDNLRNTGKRKATVAAIMNRVKAENFDTSVDPLETAIENAVLLIARETRQGWPIDWETVGRLVEIDGVKHQPEESNHGTHVAGIIGACRETSDPDSKDPLAGDGMCPDIGLYDFRVLAPDLEETEFAIIAAMQYIRYLNDRNTYRTIHGANLSLSIPHDVRNFACGRTPVCNECERLVNSGVVVVAAAGNRGYQNFQTKDGVYEGYAAFSITDPGNSDEVITVGATHRYWPHTYGVSFFSSRGPTGDGRMKPDIVAPGERIRAPVPSNQWSELDGTSMAAPHVSGAAAMLMARYTELIGQPRRIKKILCESATDLGRDRTFQGRGMLDVLRAFQSV
jgi:hypothetical protein